MAEIKRHVDVKRMPEEFKPIEFNWNHNPSAKFFKDQLSSIFTNYGISATEGKEEVCLIFDDIDGLSSGDDNNFKEFANFFKQA
jgi:hypothetical protein